MQNEVQIQMSRRRKILIVVVVTLGAAILVPVIHHYQLRAAVNDYIAELKARGEPMELSQVLPPPVPPEQNGADTFREAAALIEADEGLLTTNHYYSAMHMVAPGKAMICSRELDIRGYDVTNSWQEVTAAVAQNEKSFALLQQIVDKPEFDFQIKYQQGVADLDFSNLYLAPLKIAALRLETAALCDIHQGDTASAVKDLRVMLALVKAAQDEQFVISELVRMADVSLAITVNWEILQSTNLTEEQLGELQRDWSSLEFIRSEERAMAMERVTGEISLAKWRSSNSELQRYLDLGRKTREALGLQNGEGTFWRNVSLPGRIFLWRYWWSYPDELRCLKGYEVLLHIARFAETNGSFQVALEHQNATLDQLGISKLN